MNHIQVSDHTWQKVKQGKSWALFVHDLPIAIFLKNQAKAANQIMICNANKEVFAYADIEDIFFISYEPEKLTVDDNFVKSQVISHHRNEAVKALYYRWCLEKEKPFDFREGWYKSVEFNNFLKGIDFGSNFCIILKNLCSLTLTGGMSYDEITSSRC